MQLKANIDLEAFFDRVHQCRGEVTFHSTENDILNLRSRLCLFLFSTACAQGGGLPAGELQFRDPADAALLAEFLEG